MQENLKIYIMDCGYRGSILTIAKNEEEARKNMQGECNYSKKRTIEEHEIKDGFLYSDLGDS